MPKCPVCLSGVDRLLPAGDADIECGSCGSFSLSSAARALLEQYPEPLNRERLSEAIRDACERAAPGTPLIDEGAMSMLIGLSAL